MLLIVLVSKNTGNKKIMKQQIKVPSVGESVTQATIGEWQKKTGDYVHQNEVLVVLETDKASMDLVAEFSGKLNILKTEGEDVQVGEVIAELDTSATAEKNSPNIEKTISLMKDNSSPAVKNTPSLSAISDSSTEKKTNAQHSSSVKNFSSPIIIHDAQMANQTTFKGTPNRTLSPSVRKWVEEHKLDVSQISGTGPRGRITKQDVMNISKPSFVHSPSPPIIPTDKPEQTRERMTTIRRRIAERLVASQQNTATLTTFNEVDMTEVIALRTQYKESFQKQHNVKLGFMGFFIKAVIKALQTFPKVNAFIEGREIVYHHSAHIGVAVSTDKGLVVPVIRHADQMSLADLEKMVAFYAEKAREGKLSPEDLSGGTFTISNGGVFGSLMSTPILNPPQSGILGMHKIEQRPVVIEGQVKIKSMMYVALSYDHRMVDGRESVSFLQKVKECIEDPIRLLIDV